MSNLISDQGHHRLVKAREGYVLYNTNDMYIGKSIEVYGEYSQAECQVLQDLCQPNDYVIEVGSNFGSITLALANKVGPKGRVIAFEPQRLVFQALCGNMALNNLINVDCHWAAVGATEGSLFVPELDTQRVNNFGGLALEGFQDFNTVTKTTGRVVPQVTLDQFVDIPRLRMIKIDVEGMEEDVIKGAKAIIAKFKPVLYLENNRPDRAQSLQKLIADLGYSMYWHYPMMFNANNHFANPTNHFGNIASHNMLCTHNEGNLRIEGLKAVQ